MMTEISLNILDIAENSTEAGATFIAITVAAERALDRLTVTIEDNGCGMTEEQLSQATDPFFTTRKTRKVGLGIPFFKSAAELTGGSFSIRSAPDQGTSVTASFHLSHIDRMPLGDMENTIAALIHCHPDTDFLYTYRFGGRSFQLDTREFRRILGDIPFDTPTVASFIREYLKENKFETDGGTVL